MVDAVLQASTVKSASSPHVGTAFAASRALWLVASGASLAVLCLARALHPDPRGFGTHEQLGLPPCGFLSLTHWPCPGCGLTTAFSCMARGDVLSALRANAFGVPLFAIVCAAAPFCTWAALRDLSSREALARVGGPRTLVLLALGWMSSWIVRVWLFAA